jgi:hypothetical protein
MVVVVQLVRTPDCGSGGRRFEPDLPPVKARTYQKVRAFRLFTALYNSTSEEFSGGGRRDIVIQ